MTHKQRPLILLTNDDGYRSPGIRAAARVLSDLGALCIIAPMEQQTSSSRSIPPGAAYTQEESTISLNNGTACTVYAVSGSPAQCVRYGVLKLLDRTPDLLVSGINYGENVGTCVTISGTVGAAIEGAALGIRSIAVSLQTDEEHNFTHSPDIDFDAAAHFTGLFARMLLKPGTAASNPEFRDMDILKIEVPADATRATPWSMTRLSRHYYYYPRIPRSAAVDDQDPGGGAPIHYRKNFKPGDAEEGSDIHALRILKQVAVTPLSIDLTSRFDLERFERELRDAGGAEGG
jgi:5'-nucleotidase